MNTPWDAIKEIKKVSHAKKACEFIEAQRKALPNSEKDGGLTFIYKQAGEEFKVGSLAYYKAICLSHAWKVIEADSVDLKMPSFSRFNSPDHQEILNNRQRVIATVCSTIKAAA